MNNNRFSALNFENSYLPIHSSDLSDLWLVENLLKIYTSFMLNIESDLKVIRDELSIEQKLEVFTKFN